MSLQAKFHLALGNKYLDEGNLEKAKAAFRKATEVDPKSSVSWYNLGLVHKFGKDWAESLICNRRATEIDPRNDAAWWNMGIAATALSRWIDARRAWTGFGLKMPTGEGEIDCSYGPTPIRLAAKSTGEVVWCHRIDPARGMIMNVPLADSGHRYKDIVLHDGAPNGYRTFQGEECAVFDSLQLLVPSTYATYELTLQISSAAELENLVDLAAERDMGVEDRRNIRYLCHECSLGNPGEYTFESAPANADPVVVGVASQTKDAVQILIANWLEAHSHCALLKSEIVLSA